jgi:hypothetical protein
MIPTRTSRPFAAGAATVVASRQKAVQQPAEHARHQHETKRYPHHQSEVWRTRGDHVRTSRVFGLINGRPSKPTSRNREPLALHGVHLPEAGRGDITEPSSRNGRTSVFIAATPNGPACFRSGCTATTTTGPRPPSEAFHPSPESTTYLGTTPSIVVGFDVATRFAAPRAVIFRPTS